MRYIVMTSALLIATFGICSAASADPASSIHNFRDIEYNYTDARSVDSVRAQLLDAIPAGTRLQDAEALLQRAGAHCRLNRHDPETVHCLYNEMSAVDENFDDIRWTTRLHVVGDQVSDLTVDRQVDTHSGN
jgi:hypothetical protein